LSQIVDTDLKTAFSQQRGNANELFTQYSTSLYSSTMSFSVELLVDKEIKDKFGGEFVLKYTRLKYAVKIKRVTTERGIDELKIIEESLDTIKHDDDQWVKNYIPRKSINKWRPKVTAGKRGKPYIDTENDKVNLRQDGKGGIKREFSVANIHQAIISIVNSVDFPHALAVKEEIKNWKFLQLNPEDLRQPSSYLAKDTLTSSGQNLAATIYRIKNFDSYALKAIERKLNSLLPVITRIDVMDDKAGKQFVIQVKTQDNREFSSRVLSEGTLRLLALCVFLNDPMFKGIICFEEPENGIHPARIKMMVTLLNELASHFEEEDFGLRQIIVNSHSPVLLKDVFDIKNSSKPLIWFSELVTVVDTVDNKKEKFQITKMLPVLMIKPKPQLEIGFSEYTENEKKLNMAKVIEYLRSGDTEKIIREITEEL
jgi:hypothetical protein